MIDDAGLLDRVRGALRGEPLLGRCCLDSTATLAPPVLFTEGCSGHIRVTVRGGTVMLEGEVESAAERRLAELVAFGVAKSVRNALVVRPGRQPVVPEPVAPT